MPPLPSRSRALPLRPASTSFGRLLLSVALLVAVGSIAWLGWTGEQLRNEARLAAGRAVRVAELRGTISTLDGWMTMSARLAAASGDRRWAERYDEAAPKLDAAIAEAAALAPPQDRAALDGTLGEAHRDLVTMERRALALSRAGDLPAARALLDGPEFGYLEDEHAGGMEVFGRDLASFNDARTARLTSRAWLGALGLASAVLALVAAVLFLRGRILVRRARHQAGAVARTDALTELPNRRQFYEAAEAVLAGPADAAAAAGCALLLVDLDRFKSVNDAHGHAVGDEVLRLVASRLRRVLREGDLIARLGGDEFGLMLGREPAAAQPARSMQPARRPEAVAACVVAACAEPFVLRDDAAVQIGASVGVAVPEAGGSGLGDLMHRADVALSRAKRDGRHRFRTFEPAMDVELRSRASLEVDLRRAVAADAIVPHYQPLVDIRSGGLIGVEMLARWFDPNRGPVSPDSFIPLAEELDLIGPLTVRLLRQACRAAAAWPGEVKLACNLSPLQLRDAGLPGAIRDVLAETGFPPARLELEVTESALVGDIALARRSLEQLKALGVRLALDDFGTGYSSLRHLQTLPFDKIKIDRSFVTAMAEDAESGKIVAAVVGLGHSLGMATVAEGVETEPTEALLRGLGCDVGQGWFYGRAVPAERIATMLEALRSAPPPEAVAAEAIVAEAVAAG